MPPSVREKKECGNPEGNELVGLEQEEREREVSRETGWN